MNSNRVFLFLNFWEDRHPIVRNTIKLTTMVIVLAVVLSASMLLSPYVLKFEMILRFSQIEAFVPWAQIVVVALLFYSFLRSILLVRRKRIGFVGFGIVCIAPVGILAVFSTMPTFFSAVVGYQVGASGRATYSEFRELCDRWDERYGQVEIISFRPQELPLGLFEQDDIEVWRERDTVFIDVGGEDYSYGLACVVGGAEEPFARGAKSRYFEYRHLYDKYYEFYREPN